MLRALGSPRLGGVCVLRGAASSPGNGRASIFLWKQEKLWGQWEAGPGRRGCGGLALGTGAGAEQGSGLWGAFTDARSAHLLTAPCSPPLAWVVALSKSC